MTLKKLLFCFIVFCFGGVAVNGQSWVWVKSATNNDSMSIWDPLAIAIDTTGNIYETGVLGGKVTFNTYTLNSSSAYDEVCLVKYNSNGGVLWAKQSKIVNSKLDLAYGKGVSTDGFGNSYITGVFDDTIGFGAFKVYSDFTSLFVVKYSPTGTELWASSNYNVSKNAYAEGYAIASDDSGYTYVSGYFRDTVSFDFDTLTEFSQYSPFLVKYSPNGNIIWAKSPTLSSEYCSGFGSSVALDNAGNIYVAGQFKDTLNFDTCVLGNGKNPNGNVFIVKYSKTGNVLWAKSANLPNVDSRIFNYSNSFVYLAIDKSNNIYLTGSYLDTIQFGSYILSNGNTEFEVFIVKYDIDGNVIWVKNSDSSSGDCYPWSVATDRQQNIYLSGTFNTMISFGSLIFSSFEIEPSFIVKFDSNGNPLCGTYINNINDDNNPVISDTKSNNLYFGGDVENHYSYCIFGNDTLRGSGEEYGFLAKWQSCNNSTEGISSILSKSQSVLIFPNPSSGIFTFAGTQNFVTGKIEVFNIFGESIYNTTLKQVQGDKVIDLSSNPNGVYFYRMLNEDGTLVGNGKLIIAK